MKDHSVLSYYYARHGNEKSFAFQNMEDIFQDLTDRAQNVTESSQYVNNNKYYTICMA